MGTAEAVEQFAAWVLKHGHRLLSLSVSVPEPSEAEIEADVVKPSLEAILQAIPAACQLRDLHLASEHMIEGCDFFQSLPSLTCLSISSIEITPGALSPLLGLTQLRSLALNEMNVLVDFDLIAGSLVQLTSVEFSSYHVDLTNSPGQLSALRNLTGLQQLRLGGYAPSQRLAELEGLPVTDIGIYVGNAADVSTAASWLRPRLADKLESISLTDWGSPPVIEGSDMLKLLPAFSAAGPQFKELVFGLAQISPLVSQVAGLTQLTRLSLGYGTLEQGALCQLSTLSGLQSLVLEVYSLDAAWAEGAVSGLAAALPELTRLEVYDGETMTTSILQALGSRVKSYSGDVIVLQQQN